MLRLARDIRGRYLLAIDLVGIVLAAFLALAMRLDGVAAPLDIPAFPLIVVLLVSVRTAVNVRFGLYNRRWRFASLPELRADRGRCRARIAGRHGGLLRNGHARRLVLVVGYPRTFWPIELLLSVTFLGGIRFGIRAAAESVAARGRATFDDGQATLLYGAGEAGVLVARSARRYQASGVRPVGFLDDDPALAGGIVAGLRVFGGLKALGAAIEATGATSLLITMPSASGDAIRRAMEAALENQLEVRTVPPVTDLIDGSVDAHRIRRVRVEDLLRRPIVTQHAVNVEEIIRDRTVVITGGAGSIGSELARQVFAIGPRRLVLVDRAESPLYLVHRELETRRLQGRGSGEVRIHLANVASRASMERLIAEESPASSSTLRRTSTCR